MTHEPERGSLVIYRHDPENGQQERHRMAVVVGPVLPDSGSGRLWVGVRLPTHDDRDPVDLIDTRSIVEVQPPDRGEPPSFGRRRAG